MAVSSSPLPPPRTLGRSHKLPPEPPPRLPKSGSPKSGPPKPRLKLAGRPALILLLSMAAIAGSLAGITLVYSVNLPQIHDLERYRPSTTTELYDRKGRVIGFFALEHRVVVNYDDFAPVLRQAVVSIEDKTFWSNGGINFFRIGGALIHDLRTHGREQGASTLTMQLAKNLFLSSERTMWIKIQEAYLAIQIERSFTKQQIFTLYGNQIYLGSGQYGFEAASEYYFSKPAKDLTLTEAALLAGLPKGPSEFSPILHPHKALTRRNLVLSEMESDGVITHAQAAEAREAPLGLKIAQPQSVLAPWFQEEVRTTLEKHFDNDEVQQSGLRVYTTLDLDLQKTANQAVLDGLAAYERRHGWKGKLVNVLAQGETLTGYKHPDWATQPHVGDYVHALVMRVKPQQILARIGSNQVLLQPADWQWTEARKAGDLVKPGDIIYVHLTSATGSASGKEMRATLEQDSGAQGSLMAMDNTSGDVLAMVGGRDYDLSEYNRATQSERQVGSSFKPYVYATAIEDGARPDDIILDTPVSFGGWSPHDYENNFKGAMTLTAALADSRNVPAVKLAARVGIRNVIAMAHRFGVTENMPAYLPIALGAAGITLQEQVASYSVFPNDGVRVAPRYIRRVTDPDGITLWEDPPAIKQVISQRTARTMVQMLQAVTSYGTGAEASQLHHPLGGKTGTTSNYTDAWFLGFSPSVTCGVWVGYDNEQSLGDKETGARAALPIWMTLMKQAILGHEDEKFPADEPRQIPYQPQWTTAITAPPSAQPNIRPTASMQTAQNTALRMMPANSVNAASPRPFASRATEPHSQKPAAKRTLPAFLRRKAPPVVSPTTADKLDSMIN